MMWNWHDQKVANLAWPWSSIWMFLFLWFSRLFSTIRTIVQLLWGLQFLLRPLPGRLTRVPWTLYIVSCRERTEAAWNDLFFYFYFTFMGISVFSFQTFQLSPLLSLLRAHCGAHNQSKLLLNGCKCASDNCFKDAQCKVHITLKLS